jgi:NAD-dependent SIR2 family protein deacetylase
MLVLGSSLLVTPAADIPVETYKKGGKIIIANLQGTPLDRIAKVRVWGKTDELMEHICKEFLGIDIEKEKQTLDTVSLPPRYGQL